MSDASARQPPPVTAATSVPAVPEWTHSGRSRAPSSSSSSRSSSRGAWQRCADWLARSGGWVTRRRWELLPVGATSAVTTLGLVQQDLVTVTALGATADATPFLYGALTAGAGWATWAGLKWEKGSTVTRGAAATGLALADLTTATAAGVSWPTVTAWVLTTGAAYGLYGPWLAAHHTERMKLELETATAKAKAVQGTVVKAPDPGLMGATSEETALRRAFHALTGAVPLDVVACTTAEDGSLTAVLLTPPGKNTSPEVVIRKQTQFAANLGLPGKLSLMKGEADNQLIVRLATSDALAGTIPYSSDGGKTAADPLRLGFDDQGAPNSIRILYRHTLVAGASDWGKSGIINLIIMRLVEREHVDLYGIDMKPGSVELGPWSPVMKRIATGPHEARDLFAFLERKSNDRGQVLAELSKSELAAGREPVRKWIPGVHVDSDGDTAAIVVIIDELAELVRRDEELRAREAEARKFLARQPDVDPEKLMPKRAITDQYESRLAIDRFLAMTYIAATQQPSGKVFGGKTDARGNYSQRVCTRAGEAGHAPLIFGLGCQGRGYRPEKLDAPGKYLIAAPELPDRNPPVYRAEYVSDADIAAAVGHLHAAAPAAAPALSAVPAQPTPPPPPAAPPREVLRYPDGTEVKDWPDLYRVFLRLGSATKNELVDAGPYASRDTARHALAAWAQHGIEARKEGRATRYHLPDTQTEPESE